MHTTSSLPSLLRTTGLIKLKKGVPGVAALLLQYWGPPILPIWLFLNLPLLHLLGFLVASNTWISYGFLCFDSFVLIPLMTFDILSNGLTVLAFLYFLLMASCSCFFMDLLYFSLALLHCLLIQNISILTSMII